MVGCILDVLYTSNHTSEKALKQGLFALFVCEVMSIAVLKTNGHNVFILYHDR